MKMGLVKGEDVEGIPLSINGKKIYFDRKVRARGLTSSSTTHLTWTLS
jgi:hypothetical protein